jgi:predicted protein tyrosine phosphatase
MRILAVPYMAVQLSRVQADALISIRQGNAAAPLDTPDFAPERVLHLRFDDLWLPHSSGMLFPDQVFPSQAHVVDALLWARQMRQTLGSTMTLAVHCHAGISRSSAIGLAILADCYGDDSRAVKTLIDDNPSIWPNPLIVAWADRLLLRNGALIAAVKAAFDGWGLTPDDDALMRKAFGFKQPLPWPVLRKLARPVVAAS